MTEPTQSGPYVGPPAPEPLPAAPAPGLPAPPPQQGAPYPYTAPPAAGPGRPPAPPGSPAGTTDRTAGALLILGALLAIGGSFATLDTSVQYLGDEKEGRPVYESVAKAWSYSTSGVTDAPTSVTQLSGVPLLLGGLLAVAAAVLLLSGRGRRFPPAPALGIAGGALLFGTTLTVLTDAFNDTQWDEDGRTTTFGPGFYLLTVALLLALGGAVASVLALRGPAGALPGPAPHPFAAPQAAQPAQTPPAPPAPQHWQALPGVPGASGTPGAPGAPAAQPYPSAPPPAPPSQPHQPPPPPVAG
ncbi:hypothetical protein [Streptomyces scabiei]|uniref:hypothetical protein n=1 Tax=Streptomyces scabiei TaxID=1930 RepID=UPI0029A33391|nr:hypothetical protein [Streptomyces scabiei]MDX3522619.1 hypothetical protein [Streptomyces scabiei]